MTTSASPWPTLVPWPMRPDLDLPGGQVLGQRELDLGGAVGRRRQRGGPEGGVGEVRADDGLDRGRLAGSTVERVGGDDSSAIAARRRPVLRRLRPSPWPSAPSGPRPRPWRLAIARRPCRPCLPSRPMPAPSTLQPARMRRLPSMSHRRRRPGPACRSRSACTRLPNQRSRLDSVCGWCDRFHFQKNSLISGTFEPPEMYSTALS